MVKKETDKKTLLRALQLEQNLKKTKDRETPLKVERSSTAVPLIMTFIYIAHFIDRKDYVLCASLTGLSNPNSALFSF